MNNYTNAQWIDLSGEHMQIRVDINGINSLVPLDPANTDYQRIMQLVDSGQLVIDPAE